MPEKPVKLRMEQVRIRPIAAADADAVCTMSLNFRHYLEALGDTDDYQFDRERYLTEGFGADPAFGGFLAELNGRAVGYLLHCPCYNSDLACRELMVIDLWVEPAGRRHGVGKALMEAACDLARQRGATRLIWSVFKPNRLAYDFYQRIGGVMIEELDWMTLPVSRD
ncbi:GNAT family N-acetyltransferase [Dongia soli]|uniref:GNAT family N-acetyltransferase n=1 Tax=Dongia soli TaxID=600628 RepID=A0ABU5E5X7_9PROT|nr:GNAT family N-acetyltransferase [Dongia soli]MDY0881717.1 GNAT family N-acetyltransferase [Dongia soli]